MRKGDGHHPPQTALLSALTLCGDVEGFLGRASQTTHDFTKPKPEPEPLSEIGKAMKAERKARNKAKRKARRKRKKRRGY